MDLDPVFVKALHLLHSRNKDAVCQLKKLVDDVLGKRKAEENDKHEGSADRPGKPYEGRTHEAEKRDLEKLQDDLAELSQSTVPTKKPRLDLGKESKSSRESQFSQEKTVGRGPESKESLKVGQDKEVKDYQKDDLPDWVRAKEKEMEREREEREKEEKDTGERKRESKRHTVIEASSSDSQTEEDDEDDNTKAMETEDFDLFQGLSCIVCRQMNVTSGNQLVECQECHNLYHQECHRPPVMEKNVNDPRFVWYCSRCARSMSKVVLKPPKSKFSAPAVSKEQGIVKTSKPESAPIVPFKRVEAKSSSSKETSSSSGRPLLGLASLAANLSGKSLSSESGKHASKSGSHKSHVASAVLFSNPDVIRSAKHDSSKASSKASDSKSSHYRAEALKLSTVNPFARPEVSRSNSSTGSKSDVARNSAVGLLSKSSSVSKPPTPSSSCSTVTSTSGLAKMAASANVTSASKASSATSSGSGKMSQSTMMSADRRLQMMKKKAAAKQLEKRSYK